MIVYFPEIYEDELAYSLFARYHAHTGHLTYTATAEDLFANGAVMPSTEFIVPLSCDAVRLISEQMSFDNFIEKHTMIPYYIRFLPLERRLRAFELLKAMDKSFYDALYMRRSKTEHRKYLRYCPLCAAADREKYGETYWHRRHQLDGINICSVHSCYLLSSIAVIDSKSQRFNFIPAEAVVPKEPFLLSEISPQEKEIADYVLSVFDYPVNMQNDVPIGKFLHTKLSGTLYTSARGETVYIKKLYEDISEYYSKLPSCSIKEWWYAQKIFCAQNFHTLDICLVAVFLNISVSELLEMKMPEISPYQSFDLKVLELCSNGKSYRQIAKLMNASLSTIRVIASKSITKECG